MDDKQTEQIILDFEKCINNNDFADLLKISKPLNFERILVTEASVRNLEEALKDLETNNISSILNAEQRVKSLVDDIQEAIDEIEFLEGKIESYENVLRNVKDVVLQVEQKEILSETKNRNQDALVECLERLLGQMSFDENDRVLLLEGRFNDEQDIRSMLPAAKRLQDALNADINPALMQMPCVKYERQTLEALKSRFCQRFSNFITKLFQSSLNNNSSTSFVDAISSLDQLVDNLQRYQPILEWLESNHYDYYVRVMGAYSEVSSRLRERCDSIMNKKLLEIKKAKPPKKVKCGVLDVVKDFTEFVREVEQVFRNTQTRRTDIDRWYLTLVTELFETIERTEQHKSVTPTEMIKLENYNYLDSALRSMKIQCLDGPRKEANLRYKKALADYVSLHFGRPLEKLNIFFEGVQHKVAQGVKEDEIGYQLAYSKQELRKVIMSVTLKEVKEGLENMYSKVKKHACEPETNLTEVIWRSMQEEFISQYKSIQEMIERCYPSTNLTLNFTIGDVLQVFSDIAQSH